MANYERDISNGALNPKSYQESGKPEDKTHLVNWMQLILSEPVSSEALLSSMSSLPLMILDKEKGYFLESGVDIGNGHIVKIYYYIDQATLTITNVLIHEVGPLL